MTNELLILYLNAVVYVVTLVLFIRYKKTIKNMGVFLFALYTMSSIAAAWYYSYPMVPVYYPNITAPPLVYLYTCIVVCIIPTLQMDVGQVVGLDDSNIRKYLNIISIFLSITCIIPLLELLFKITSINFSGSFLNQMYESGEDHASVLFSNVGKKLFSPLRHFSDFSILLFFYQMSKEKVQKKILIGLSCAILTLVLFKIMSGSRGGIFGVLFSLVFYFSIFRNAMPQKRCKTVTKIIFVFGISFFLGIGAITISRFNNSVGYKKDQSIDLWISQYAGESFIRFANTIWTMDVYADGNQNLAIVKDVLGTYNFKTYDQYLYQEGNRLKVILNVFYTFVGDLYIDFGKYGTIIAILLLSLFEIRTTKIKNGRINILQLYILGILFSLLSYGFCANVYRGIYVQKNLVLPLIAVISLYLLQKHPLIKRK